MELKKIFYMEESAFVVKYCGYQMVFLCFDFLISFYFIRSVVSSGKRPYVVTYTTAGGGFRGAWHGVSLRTYELCG